MGTEDFFLSEQVQFSFHDFLGGFVGVCEVAFDDRFDHLALC